MLELDLFISENRLMYKVWTNYHEATLPACLVCTCVLKFNVGTDVFYKRDHTYPTSVCDCSSWSCSKGPADAWHLQNLLSMLSPFCQLYAELIPYLAQPCITQLQPSDWSRLLSDWWTSEVCYLWFHGPHSSQIVSVPNSGYICRVISLNSNSKLGDINWYYYTLRHSLNEIQP